MGYTILDVLKNENSIPQGGVDTPPATSADNTEVVENTATPPKEDTPSDTGSDIPTETTLRPDYGNNDAYLSKFYSKQNTDPNQQKEVGDLSETTVPAHDSAMWDEIYDKLYPKPEYDEKAEIRKRNQAGIKNAFSLIGNLIASKYIKPTHKDIDIDAEIQQDKDRHTALMEKWRTGKINQAMAREKAALNERLEGIKAKNKEADNLFKWYNEVYKQDNLNNRANASNETRLAIANSNNQRAYDVANINATSRQDVAEINAQNRQNTQNKPELILPVDDGTGNTFNVPLTSAQARMLEAYMLQNVPDLDKPLGTMNTGRANTTWAASMASKYPSLMTEFLLSQGLIKQTGDVTEQPSTQPQYEGETAPETQKVLRDSSGNIAKTYNDVQLSDKEYNLLLKTRKEYPYLRLSDRELVTALINKMGGETEDAYNKVKLFINTLQNGR